MLTQQPQQFGIDLTEHARLVLCVPLVDQALHFPQFPQEFDRPSAAQQDESFGHGQEGGRDIGNHDRPACPIALALTDGGPMLARILILLRVSAFDLRLARRATTRQLTCLAAPRYTSTLAPLRHRLAGRSGYPLACPPATSRPHPSAASDKRSPLDSSALNAPAQSSPYPRSRGRLWLKGGSARGSYSHRSVP